MKINKEPAAVWREYQNGRAYKEQLGLYEQVRKNENFYNDRQWEGVKAPDLVKPVFNFLKPVVNYYIAMLISDDIAANIEVMDGEAGQEIAGIVPRVISTEIDGVMERANVKFKNRKMIRNCAVDGDACFYVWFDTDAETGFSYKGQIEVDLVDNTNVYFGNPSEADPQKQPYILISSRRLTADVKDEAEKNGVDPDEVTPDAESMYVNAEKDTENEYTTVLLKLWKENGTVHMIKSTEKVVIKSDTDTEYRLYPLAWMSWEDVKNSYHGVSPITGKIQNQVFVNKLYALAMIQVQNTSFPKPIFNKNVIDHWSSNPGEALGVAGPVDGSIFSSYRPPDMSAQVNNLIDSVIKYTKDMMGASDAALGNVNPDNTSAIIAVQKAAGLPLDIQRMDFYNFVESYVRIFIDIMRVNYGKRNIILTNSDGEKEPLLFDYAVLNDIALHLNIDIGQAAYWSELTQVQTLDNLMDRKILPDAVTYLESMPDGYIKNKQEIIGKIKEMMQGAVQEQAGMLPAGADGGMQQPQSGQPEMQPEGGLSDEEIMSVVQGMQGMGKEEALEVIDAMQVTDDDKAQVLAAYEAMGGRNGQ